jgi:glyceraldehyde 3-phosphate dehydrogenase
MKKISLLINGFGRIGKSVLRILSKKNFVNRIYINDINEDFNNLIYSYNFDKLVHTFKIYPKIVKKKNFFYLGNIKIIFSNLIKIQTNRQFRNVDIIIDCSGITTNSENWLNLINENKKLKIFFTFDHPLSEIHLVLGANESKLSKNHKFISTSICDATALAPFLKVIDKNFIISHGNITTIHPMLNYQNLLDGRSVSWSSPNKTYSHYSLGRSALDNLIPKPTSALAVTAKSLKDVDLSNVNSFSYRVPTTIVGSADITLVLKKNFNVDLVLKILKKEIKKQKFKIFYINNDARVSSDYYMNEYSLIYDHSWSSQNKDIFHAVLWYDNENGYANRVVDQIQYMLKKLKS